MDQGLGEDAVHHDAEHDAHVQYKYSEHSLKPENCETLESREEALQRSPGSPECSFDVIADILGGKNVENDNSTDNLCSSPNVIEDVGDMVEELTVQNCDGSDIAIVGTSNNREKIQHQQKQFRNSFQLVGGPKVMGSYDRLNINSTASNVQAETSNRSFPESSAQKSISGDHIEARDQLESVDRNALSNETFSSGGIKTKILSKSGFSKFFVKTTLKGKGIICNGPAKDKLRARSIEQKSIGATSDPKLASNASIKLFGGSLVAPDDASLSLQALNTKQPSLHVAVAADRHRANESEGLSLREWLKSEHHKKNKTECLYVFRKIVDLVDHSHSQGLILYDLRPSCFKMLKGNRVRYTGSSFQRDTYNPENPLTRKRQPSNTCPSLKKQKVSDNVNFSQWPLFRRASIKTETENVNNVNVSGYSNVRSGQEQLDTGDHPFGSMIELSEQKWYASPEELGGGICTMHSNVFKLGILLFELLARFGSERLHAAAMSDLRHRILPPSFLSENPKEAGFCLWLLHPEPSCRPTSRDIMQSEVVNGIQEMFAKELSSSIEQEDTESELLLHFLSSLQEHKEKHASNLRADILCLEDDIKEVEKRRSVIKPREPTSEVVSCPSPLSNLPETRLFTNINQLESVYFSMRTNVNSPETHRMMRPDIDLLRNGDNHHSQQGNLDTMNSTDRVGAFFDGLCKYARYSKFEMRGLLRTGEFNNSANVICSLSFDRDEEYFAAAGISKKIKVYEFGSIFNDSVDIHYPAIEMANRSRLSSVCWNNYIKNYLASSDYDGIVKLWDVTTGQTILQLSEHEKRAWSVDFSQLYPTKLASGSDDCTVKLWNINERNCSGTIRNIANVCCVQFSPHSTNLVAFGSADYRTYCYDLRNLRVPWCILTGHDKAVSYVKFLDHETLITASTDNTLKLWDLKKTTHGGLSTNACSLTFKGHTNEKNFVGLSVKDGYVACGSETNEVYGYHRSLPMPVTSYKFGSIDPISGRETDDDNGQFVSSVCWQQKSDMILAANSSGCIKVLQMV